MDHPTISWLKTENIERVADKDGETLIGDITNPILQRQKNPLENADSYYSFFSTALAQLKIMKQHNKVRIEEDKAETNRRAKSYQQELDKFSVNLKSVIEDFQILKNEINSVGQSGVTNIGNQLQTLDKKRQNATEAQRLLNYFQEFNRFEKDVFIKKILPTEAGTETNLIANIQSPKKSIKIGYKVFSNPEMEYYGALYCRQLLDLAKQVGSIKECKNGSHNVKAYFKWMKHEFLMHLSNALAGKVNDTEKTKSIYHFIKLLDALELEDEFIRLFINRQFDYMLGIKECEYEESSELNFEYIANCKDDSHFTGSIEKTQQLCTLLDEYVRYDPDVEDAKKNQEDEEGDEEEIIEEDDGEDTPASEVPISTNKEVKHNQNLVDEMLETDKPTALELTIVKCYDLHGADFNLPFKKKKGMPSRTSDPYVKVFVGPSGLKFSDFKDLEEVYKTKTIPTTLSPVFDETVFINFRQHKGCDTVYLSVYDHDKTSKDDSLGWTSISFPVDEVTEEYKVRLTNIHKGGIVYKVVNKYKGIDYDEVNSTIGLSREQVLLMRQRRLLITRRKTLTFESKKVVDELKFDNFVGRLRRRLEMDLKTIASIFKHESRPVFQDKFKKLKRKLSIQYMLKIADILRVIIKNSEVMKTPNQGICSEYESFLNNFQHVDSRISNFLKDAADELRDEAPHVINETVSQAFHNLFGELREKYCDFECEYLRLFYETTKQNWLSKNDPDYLTYVSQISSSSASKNAKKKMNFFNSASTNSASSLGRQFVGNSNPYLEEYFDRKCIILDQEFLNKIREVHVEKALSRCKTLSDPSQIAENNRRLFETLFEFFIVHIRRAIDATLEVVESKGPYLNTSPSDTILMEVKRVSVTLASLKRLFSQHVRPSISNSIVILGECNRIMDRGFSDITQDVNRALRVSVDDFLDFINNILDANQSSSDFMQKGDIQDTEATHACHLWVAEFRRQYDIIRKCLFSNNFYSYVCVWADSILTGLLNHFTGKDMRFSETGAFTFAKDFNDYKHELESLSIPFIMTRFNKLLILKQIVMIHAVNLGDYVKKVHEEGSCSVKDLISFIKLRTDFHSKSKSSKIVIELVNKLSSELRMDIS